jgi:hypothetical protein
VSSQCLRLVPAGQTSIAANHGTAGSPWPRIDHAKQSQWERSAKWQAVRPTSPFKRGTSQETPCGVTTNGAIVRNKAKSGEDRESGSGRTDFRCVASDDAKQSQSPGVLGRKWSTQPCETKPMSKEPPETRWRVVQTKPTRGARQSQDGLAGE